MEQLSVTHCELARDPPFFCLLFGCVLPARLHTPLYWGSNTLCFSVVALLCCCRSVTSSSLLSSVSSLILKQCLVPLLHNFLNYIFFSLLLSFLFRVLFHRNLLLLLLLSFWLFFFCLLFSSSFPFSCLAAVKCKTNVQLSQCLTSTPRSGRLSSHAF